MRIDSWDMGRKRWSVEEKRQIVELTSILEIIRVVKPIAGFLGDLRRVAHEFGFLLISGAVKTGFRRTFGEYGEISGVIPDLTVYGMAVASGYPLGTIGRPARWLDYFVIGMNRAAYFMDHAPRGGWLYREPCGRKLSRPAHKFHS